MTWETYCKSFISKVNETYERYHHMHLNLSNPTLFTEKLQWLKIYDSTMLKTLCADKINVHKYFISALGCDIGVPIYKIFDSINAITLNDIHSPCVLKCNHGSGMNIVVKPDTNLRLPEVKTQFKQWLATDHGNKFAELYYSRIKPTIFSEMYLDDMQDVKVFCFNGYPKFYQIDRHFTEHRLNFYDLNWQPLTWLSMADYPADYSIIDDKPPIDVIYRYAIKLCSPFKFVRCDFIVSKGHVYGGELTFIPGAGNQSYLGDGDRILGDMLDLQ